MKLLRSALTLCLLAIGVPAAFAARTVTVTPLPSGTSVQNLKVGSPAADECGIIYDNTTNQTGYYYDPSAADVEVADDLHMVSAGNLCQFSFVYYRGSPDETSATVTFYANDPTDNPPVTIVAGPYSFSTLPGSGAWVVTASVAPVPVPPDVWMGVSFGTTLVGLVIMDPPTVGSSNDYFYETPPGDYSFFGGNPVANFGLQVRAAIATPARPSTWGSIKQLYR